MGPSVPEQRGRVHEAVEAPELRLQCARHVAEIVGGRLGEVERQDDGLRMLRGDDLVVERFELAHDAPVQDHRGAQRRAGARQRRAEAAAGAGDRGSRDRAARRWEVGWLSWTWDTSCALFAAAAR